MSLLAKLATAKIVTFGPILDSAGAEYTGAAVGDIKIMKNGLDAAALDGSATLTHRTCGHYSLSLTANDISVVGEVTVILSKTTYLAAPLRLVVLPAKVYDSLVGGTDNLEVDAIQWLGTAILTPGTAGTPDVNTKLVGGTAQTARDLGLALPAAAPGAASGLPLIAASGGFLNVANLPQVAHSAANGLPTVGTGTGQVNLSGGRADANLEYVHGTTIAGTGTQVAAAFLNFFNVASPTGTVNSLPAAIPGASTGLLISGSNTGTTTLGALTVTGATTLSGGVATTTIAASGAITGASLTLSGAFQAATIVSTGTTTLNALTVTNAATLGSLTSGVVTVTGGMVIGNTGGVGLAITGSTTGMGIHGATIGLDVDASAGPGIDVDGTTYGIVADASAGVGFAVTGTTGGFGCVCSSSGAGISSYGATAGAGLLLSSTGTGPGLLAQPISSGHGIVVAGVGSGNHGISIAAGSGAGKGIQVDTISSSGTVTLNALVVTTTTDLTGDVHFGANWHVIGTTQFQGDVTHTGLTTYTGNVLHSGTTTYHGAVAHDVGTTYTGAVLYSSTETHTGAVVNNGGITTTTWAASSNVSIGGTLGVTGTTTLSTLAVTTTGLGATTLGATAIGAITQTGAVSLGATTLASVYVTGLTTLHGAALLDSTLTVTGATTLTGAVVLSSTLTTGAVTHSALTVTNALTAGSNAVPWNAAWDAEVESECTDALNLITSHYGTCPAGSTYSVVKLEVATSSALDDYYNGSLLQITSGTGAGQARFIADYVGSTHSATVDSPFVTAPGTSATYRVVPFSPILLADSGTAVTPFSASTIKLAASAPAITDALKGHTVFLSGGTGIGQARIIVSYTNTRIATVSPDWTTTPDATTTYLILPVGRVYVDEMSTAALAAVNAQVDTALSDWGKTGFSLAATGADLILKTSTFALAMADVVWDEVLDVAHEVGGSASVLLQAAGGASDPLLNAVPGAYLAGTAGYVLGTNLNATVGSRSSHSAADIWSVVTRTLTAGTNIALAKGTGVTGFNDLAAADVRTAVGLASANLDTQLANLPTDADVNAQCDTALTDWGKTGFKLASDGVDAIVEETGLNMRQAIAVIAAACVGKLSGAATTTITIKAAHEGTTTRIVATVDEDGDRPSVTLTLPA